MTEQQSESGGLGFVVRPRKSPFVREASRPPAGIVCPPCYILAHANGCPYSCDYCFLQLTFRHIEAPTVFSNREDLLGDVRRFLMREKPSVLNLGKLADALAFDPVTGLSRDVVPLFASQDRHKLLLLTKSTNVWDLLDMPYRRNVVVAFSVNGPQLAARFERGAPSPFERLEAARACQDAGFEVRLKIDPVIPVAGWEDDYDALVRRIMKRLRTHGLRITVGSVRYFRSLPRYARRRGRDTSVFDVARTQDGVDGRMRVAPDQRLHIYQWMRQRFPDTVSVAICKEPAAMWRRLGWDPQSAKCNCSL